MYRNFHYPRFIFTSQRYRPSVQSHRLHWGWGGEDQIDKLRYWWEQRDNPWIWSECLYSGGTRGASCDTGVTGGENIYYYMFCKYTVPIINKVFSS